MARPQRRRLQRPHGVEVERREAGRPVQRAGGGQRAHRQQALAAAPAVVDAVDREADLQMRQQVGALGGDGGDLVDPAGAGEVVLDPHPLGAEVVVERRRGAHRAERAGRVGARDHDVARAAAERDREPGEDAPVAVVVPGVGIERRAQVGAAREQRQPEEAGDRPALLQLRGRRGVGVERLEALPVDQVRQVLVDALDGRAVERVHAAGQQRDDGVAALRDGRVAGRPDRRGAQARVPRAVDRLRTLHPAQQPGRHEPVDVDVLVAREREQQQRGDERGRVAVGPLEPRRRLHVHAHVPVAPAQAHRGRGVLAPPVVEDHRAGTLTVISGRSNDAHSRLYGSPPRSSESSPRARRTASSSSANPGDSAAAPGSQPAW